jgi:hypothetical protein
LSEFSGKSLCVFGKAAVEYLTLAVAVDQQAVAAIVERLVPKTLWELGVDNPEDPTYVHVDISWPVDANEWEKAQAGLAAITERQP